MSTLKTVFLSVMLILLTQFSFELVDDSFGHAQFQAKAEIVDSLDDYFSGDVILPSVNVNSLYRYQTSCNAVEELYEVVVITCPSVVENMAHPPMNDNIKCHSLTMIFPFHSFW